MLWDDTALYVAARLEDKSLFANQTLHDSIVYHDNNFEVRTRCGSYGPVVCWLRQPYTGPPASGPQNHWTAHGPGWPLAKPPCFTAASGNRFL